MPSTGSALHQRGQKLYQKGEFKAAIEVFGEALKQKDADAIGILDNRAATYCKLENYDQARRDTRHMIKNGKEDERGYLRCAKVLLLEGKPEKALEIYAYGLKMLPSEHPRRGMLEQLHNKLQDRMLLNKRDPFTLLPLEIANMVIDHFSFKQIVAILRVCKDWERFFGSTQRLWMRIDLSGARGKVPWTAVRSYIRRSKAMVSHAIIKNLVGPSTPKAIEFLSRCPRLEHLELWVTHDQKDIYERFKGCKTLKSLILSADIISNRDYLAKFLTELPRLERIELWNTRGGLTPDPRWPQHLPNLKSITVASQQSVPGGIPDYLHPMHVPGIEIPATGLDFESHPYPNLEELRLDWDPPSHRPFPFPLNSAATSLPPLRRLDLCGISPSANFLQVLPTSLEYLRLQAGPSRPPEMMDLPENILPNLHTLIFNDSGWVTNDTLTAFLLAFKPPLRTLHLDQCFNISGLTLLSILESQEAGFAELHKLTELSLSHMGDVTDNYARYLYKVLLELKVLNLSYTGITGVTIRMFADARAVDSRDGARLDRLFVRGCENVSSDAVAYGREKGLEVVA
ncbi:uncharacterized protein N7459_006174 [Penicillium hispanicum]|uniref:uncharacterized protein n=1 Tax=Penicillium hispanicum TaxID=1080232 RepID=UPI0025411249|nr:uncharacterized protein N7459_006174 [Penicillium hispanicum]KAJ5580189.1 hypothetical protein N7459_006174 [Penicillium hispanicum]